MQVGSSISRLLEFNWTQSSDSFPLKTEFSVEIMMPTNRQYRMSFNEICRPLKAFHSSRELVVSVRDAMEGEHLLIIYSFENNIFF